MAQSPFESVDQTIKQQKRDAKRLLALAKNLEKARIKAIFFKAEKVQKEARAELDRERGKKETIERAQKQQRQQARRQWERGRGKGYKEETYEKSTWKEWKKERTSTWGEGSSGSTNHSTDRSAFDSKTYIVQRAYAYLGIDASETIERAVRICRGLKILNHPDKFAGCADKVKRATIRFQEIQKYYEILTGYQ
jgi:hypothetical protein